MKNSYFALGLSNHSYLKQLRLIGSIIPSMRKKRGTEKTADCVRKHRERKTQLRGEKAQTISTDKIRGR